MRRLRALRAPRPSPRQLGGAVAVLGVLGALACLVVPVEAAFADHPLMRFEPFSPALAAAVTDVDCGVPVSNFGRRSDGLSLYALARDDACREAASHRAATAVATGAVIGLLSLIRLTGARPRGAVA